jgi:hypothetical protein
MTTFDDLAASRRQWIADILQPWCRAAPLAELRKAEREWGDIAGRVEPEFTLWLWAWSRFDVLYVEGLKGVDETFEVRVRLKSGEEHCGFPDARQTRRGTLVLQGEEGQLGPFSIDDIASVERRLTSGAAGRAIE